MNFLKSSLKKENVRVPVEAVALFVLLMGLPSEASTGSSWVEQPVWATHTDSTAPPAQSRKFNAGRESRYNGNVTPFSPGSNNLALDIGQVFLMGNLNSHYSDSIGAQVHYTYGVSDLFGFDSSLGFSDHSDGKFSMTTLLTGLRTNLAWYDKVVPYLVFGLGFYRPSYQQASQNTLGTNVGDATASVSPVLFGIHMGPGVDLELTKQLFFGAALTFHDMFGSTRIGANGLAQEVGGTYTTFFLHAGTTF